jgi:hypothetical protein
MSCPYCRSDFRDGRSWVAHLADPWRCPQRPAYPASARRLPADAATREDTGDADPGLAA